MQLLKFKKSLLFKKIHCYYTNKTEQPEVEEVNMCWYVYAYVKS